MKTLLLLPLVLAAPAFAGTSAKEVTAPPAPSCLTTWFAGASVGYLTNLDTAMYTLHLGVTNSCWTIAGWNVSFYVEGAYAEKDHKRRSIFIDDELAAREDFDIKIVPVTANVKFEHQITGNLNAYLGGGLGAAWIDADAHVTTPNGSFNGSDSKWVFCAQVFAGLSYDVTPNWAIYGGGRWIYFDNAELFNDAVSVHNDWLVELGTRVKF